MMTPLKSSTLALGALFAGTIFGVEQNEMAPDFMLPVLGDESTQSLSASRGKVRYVDFWASWCAPCRVSIPQIIALQEELSGDDFEVIGINVDERIEDALDFLEYYSFNYVNLSDPQGAVAESYELKGMPMSFVVDPEGRVTLTHAGFRRGDMQAIRAHILELLGRQPAGQTP